MRSRIAWTILALSIVAVAVAVLRFNISAIPDPGGLETRAANAAKAFYIHSASRRGVPQRPQDTKASVDSGSNQFGPDCSICHGSDGRAQEPPGKWMYPRVADLTSMRVQSYSDRELYWIIQNGIRLSGMPAFAKVETPQHIWDLVNYVRTLRTASQDGHSSK